MLKKNQKLVYPTNEGNNEKPTKKLSKAMSFIEEPPSTEPKSKQQLIKEAIYETAADSTAHSIPLIFKRESIVLKVFWFVCLLAATGVCSWMISTSIIDYLGYDTVSKTENVLEIPTLFPTVSFCNMNAFLTNSSLEFVKNLLIKNGLYDPNSSQNLLTTANGTTFLTLRYFAGINALSPNLTDQDRRAMGFNLKDVMISCTYDLQICTADDFEWYYDTLYGSCYKFNSGRNASGHSIPDRISTKAGKINGLSIELYVDEPTNPLSLSTSAGVHVSVHNKSWQPYFFDGFDLPTGMVGNVVVSRMFSSLLESPYSECQIDIDSNPSELVRAVRDTDYKFNYSYRQSDCFDTCFQRQAVKICQCHDLTAPYWAALNSTPCLNITQVLCDIEQFSLFYSQDVKALCSSECPLECDSIVYTIATSFAEYPSAAYASVLVNNPIINSFFNNNKSAITLDALRRRIASFNVFYSHLSYSKYIEFEKTSIADLVSSVGGTLGLFLGMSFLSVMEIVDLAVQIIFILAKN